MTGRFLIPKHFFSEPFLQYHLIGLPLEVYLR